MKIALIIFTKNERRNSEKIFGRIPKNLVDKIYVIDANSSDGTQEFWKSKGIEVFPQKYKGVGGAYESAWRNTKEDTLIFFHPDGNMEPYDLKKFVKLLKEGFEFIIAGRMGKDGYNEEDDQLLKPRKWFCQGMGLIATIVWGRGGNKCTDPTQGYRAFARKAYEKLRIKIPPPNASDYQQIIRALKTGVKITEFPTKEGKRVYGKSTFPSLKTGLDQLKLFYQELIA
ncbi:glycosyltransferase [Candidatus Daviesbacteria bacterium]|nr:glycosyltransferase [Candidatus Daviesbacteria bacterium]